MTFVSACGRKFSDPEARDDHEDNCLVCVIVEEDEAFEEFGFDEEDED